MQLILERLKCQNNRKATRDNYLGVWRCFNKFLLRLDSEPPVSWEERTSLFVAYVVENGLQSTSVRSYVSAIKKTLVDDDYHWDDSKILLTSLTKACKLLNDRVKIRLPIHCGLLEMILFQIQRKFGYTQPYLETLFLAMFALGYYGLFRVGELCLGLHFIKQPMYMRL